MVDATLTPGRWRTGPRITPVLLKRAAGLLLAFLIALGWSAVMTKTARECKEAPGAFSSGFNRGFDTARRECPSQSDLLPLGIP